MKTMKNILTSLLIVLFIASCSAPTEPEKPEKTYPYTVGTWTVQSPTEADWNGVNSKQTTMSADTVVIDHPGQQELSITRDNYMEHGFVVHFSDTTIKYGEIVATQTQVSFPDSTFSGSDSYSGHLGIDFDYDSGYLNMSLDLNVNCDFNGQANRLYITLYKDHKGTIHKFYELKTSGFLTAVKDVAGCD